jgi:threonine/homoserine/homoserine lactone efflux protein
MLEWLTVLIAIVLAVSNFYAALHPKLEKNIVLSSNLPKFLLGLTMSAVNPVQIPFWFGWSTVLFAKKVLLPRNDHYNSYIVGIAFGTLAGNCVFIFSGQLMVDKLNANQHIVSWAIGGIFALTAIIQVVKIFRKKDPVHQMEHPEEVTHGLEEKIIELTAEHEHKKDKHDR